MHAVTGAYASPIFVDKLGASPVCYDSVISYYYVIAYIIEISIL